MATLFTGAYMTQAMFDAVVSLHYNAYVDPDWRFTGSLKVAAYERSRDEIDIITSNGIKVDGLKKRRKGEQDVFWNNDYSGRP